MLLRLRTLGDGFKEYRPEAWANHRGPGAAHCARLRMAADPHPMAGVGLVGARHWLFDEPSLDDEQLFEG